MSQALSGPIYRNFFLFETTTFLVHEDKAKKMYWEVKRRTPRHGRLFWLYRLGDDWSVIAGVSISSNPSNCHCLRSTSLINGQISISCGAHYPLRSRRRRQDPIPMPLPSLRFPNPSLPRHFLRIHSPPLPRHFDQHRRASRNCIAERFPSRVYLRARPGKRQSASTLQWLLVLGWFAPLSIR